MVNIGFSPTEPKAFSKQEDLGPMGIIFTSLTPNEEVPNANKRWWYYSNVGIWYLSHSDSASFVHPMKRLRKASKEENCPGNT